MSTLFNSEKTYNDISSAPFDLTLRPDTHRLLTFLNAWGCRQFALADHDNAARALSKWFIDFRDILPKESAVLSKISEKKIIGYKSMFDALQQATASTNKNGHIKTVGAVGAAKALFALRRHSFPPWDNPMIEALQFQKNGDGYVEYLLFVKSMISSLASECKSKRLELNHLPKAFSRPGVSLVKLIDEYLWLTLTRNCDIRHILSLSKEKS